MQSEHFISASRPGSPGHEQRTFRHLQILTAAIALINQGGEAAVTIRAVARMVGISERTVHRHFQTREVLLRAVWKELLEQVGQPVLPRTVDELVERPRRLFPRLSRYRVLVRAYLYNRSFWETLRRPNRQTQRAIVACVAEEVGLDEPSRRRRAAVIELLSSAYACEMMQEAWGFSGEEAGEAASEAIEVLLNRARY